jgi:hypothetical protein
VKFHIAERIADAVLYEGYVLYPYRASAIKNRMRWQFGIIAPKAPDEGAGEPWFQQTECLIEGAAVDIRLSVRLRFLTTHVAAGLKGPPSYVQGVRPESAPVTPWLEGIPQSIEVDDVSIGDATVVRDLRQTTGIDARLCIEMAPLGTYVKVRIRVENLDPWQPEFAVNRDALLQRSLVSAHLLLGVDRGAFVSLLDPPEEAEKAIADCRNERTWPVLVGEHGGRQMMLSSPIVLYDYPALAPESQGDLCDGTEIDEILSLRIMTLTDEEKREARATDPRAGAIIDRTDAMSADALSRLHGTMRMSDFFNPADEPSPDEAFVVVGSARIEKGSRVRLRPNRRADAMDMFLRDQPATVAGVYRDVDQRTYVAVTVDADPGADMHASFGRFFYFDPEEMEPL